MNSRLDKVVDFIANVVMTACVFVIGVAVGGHEKECPKPPNSNAMLYRQGLEVYSTEELQRIINARRRMERVKEKEK